MAESKPKPKSPTKEQLLADLADLKMRLQETEETLAAIHSGAVDAIVVSGTAGDQVYTLQGADQSYRLLVESINEGTVTLSGEGTILYSNRQFADMLGYPLEKVIGASFLKFVSQENRHHFEEALHSRLNRFPRFQALLNSYEWGKIPAQIALSINDASGVRSLTAVVTDLSEQLRYREIVREEKLSRAIMENSPDGIAVCDTKGVVIRESRALNRFCRESALMKSFDGLFHVEIPAKEGPPASFALNEILAGSQLEGVEARLYCSGSRVYEIELSAAPLKNEDGAVIGCLISMADITERKRNAEALRESERRFRLALKRAPVSVAIQDRNLVYQWAYTQQGRHSGEVVGKTDADLYAPEDLAWMVEQKRRVIDSGTPMHLQSWVTHCGKRLFLDLYYEPMRDSAGGITGIGIAAVDLTELKQAEEKRIRAEEVLAGQSAKLEAANKELEAFAYSVSHDLRAPLRAIEGFTRMLLKAADKLDDDERRRFEVIRENTRKMGKLIDDLLAFSRLGRQSISMSDIDMADLVHQVWEELLVVNPSRRMSLKTEPLPAAFGDCALIRQVLVNLLSNAFKFSRKREAALIEIGAKTADSEIVYFVRDNGTGFDMGYYDKLFGVFQRLHGQEEYEAGGPGRPIVRPTANRHGGRVWAEGKVDQGATFYFALPGK
jgi:PAS domain S-box-containing protein